MGPQPGLRVHAALGRHTSVGIDFEYFIAGSFLPPTGPSSNVTFLATWVSFVV